MSAPRYGAVLRAAHAFAEGHVRSQREGGAAPDVALFWQQLDTWLAKKRAPDRRDRWTELEAAMAHAYAAAAAGYDGTGHPGLWGKQWGNLGEAS